MEQVVYPLKIFLKLGKDSETAYNGRQMIREYKEFLQLHTHTWFGTSALALGINKERKEEFIRAIREGQVVEIYFGIGKVYDGINEIYAKANVLEIITGRSKIVSPEPILTPKLWQLTYHETWFKIEGLIEVGEEDRIENFKIASTGSELKWVCERSRLQFGYIVKK